MKTYLTQLILVAGLLIAGGSVAASITSFTSDREHTAAGGGKGVITINLAAPSGQCVNFNSVQVDYKRRRYGQAQIIKTPSVGCNPDKSQCQVEVAWEHAPAGRLTYRLKVNWTSASNC